MKPLLLLLIIAFMALVGFDSPQRPCDHSTRENCALGYPLKGKS